MVRSSLLGRGRGRCSPTAKLPCSVDTVHQGSQTRGLAASGRPRQLADGGSARPLAHAGPVAACDRGHDPAPHQTSSWWNNAPGRLSCNHYARDAGPALDHWDGQEAGQHPLPHRFMVPSSHIFSTQHGSRAPAMWFSNCCLLKGWFGSAGRLWSSLSDRELAAVARSFLLGWLGRDRTV
eukprot:361612-Chlamydomonas_euryale.AAC.14